MEIKDINGFGLQGKKVEKPATEPIRIPKKSEGKDQPRIEKTEEQDSIELSPEAQELKQSEDELKVARELLSKLPNFRAHVIYEALAKLKAGVYSDEQIMAEVAARLLDSEELRGLL